VIFTLSGILCFGTMWHNRFEEHTAFDLRVEMLVISYQTTRLHDLKAHSIAVKPHVTHV